MKSILVIGSTNTDMVVKTSSFPKAGETVMGGEFFMFPGGKGANQAVAASRMGGKISFLTKIGNDVFGEKSILGFKKEGISTKLVFKDPSNNSGVALITIRGDGENSIVVAPGANDNLSMEGIDKASEEFKTTDFILFQLEIPIETVEYIVQKASKTKSKLILNPAPVKQLKDNIYPHLYLITPNESEASLLTGVEVCDEESAKRAAKILLEKGVENVIITLGRKGAYFLNATTELMVPSFKTKAVDTTAAGDVFNGAIAVALAEEKDWKKAIELANKAASIAVSRMGAQSSAPYRSEVII